MYKLVLLRHGQSTWNLENRFTGWTDVDLSPQGEREAKQAGIVLKENGFTFDIAFTSVLRRAIKTLWFTLDSMDLHWLPVYKAWELNERHYGDLQGFNKAETAEKYGDEQVLIWRRSYDTPPLPMTMDDERYAGKDTRYSKIPEENIPLTECLKDTVKRVIPYYENKIKPYIKDGRNVIITAHGNSLRALVMYLDNISEEEIVSLNIPTGVPLVYELDNDLKPKKSYYLGDNDAIKKAQEEVANQGKSSK